MRWRASCTRALSMAAGRQRGWGGHTSSSPLCGSPPPSPQTGAGLPRCPADNSRAHRPPLSDLLPLSPPLDNRRTVAPGRAVTCNTTTQRLPENRSMTRTWIRLILLLVVVFIQGCCWSQCPQAERSILEQHTGRSAE